MGLSQSADVLILGGGPAGSTAGALLAGDGFATTLIEEGGSHRIHVGESLIPHTLPLLDQLGIHETVRRLPSARRKEGATFLSPDGNRKATHWFDQALAPAIPHAYNVHRDELDAALLEHARNAGVEVLSGWRAISPIMDGQRFAGVLARDGQGIERAFTARVLIDASGQSSFLASRMGWRFPYPKHRKVAVFSHFRGAWLPPGRERGNICIVLTEKGWTWLIPFADDTVSAGFVLDADHWKASTTSADDLFADALTRTPEVARRLREAEPLIPLCTEKNFSFRVMRVAGDGYCLVGDAAGFLDPVFSTGIFLALTTAASAAEDISEALCRRGRVESSDFGPTIALTRRLHRLFFSFVRSFYDPHFLALFFSPQPALGIQAAMVSLCAGDVLRPGRWHRTLRYRILRLASHVQEWSVNRGHPLVPPLDPTPTAGIPDDR